VVADSHERLRHPLALFAVAALVGVTIAFASGVPIGFLAAESALNDCSPGDGWCGLGAALAGIFVGLLVGVIAYVVAGVAIVRRCRQAGRRAGHIAAHIAAPLGFAVLAGFTANL
jgi:hypothetical protein